MELLKTLTKYWQHSAASLPQRLPPIATGHPLLSAPSRLGVSNMNLNHPTPCSITALEIQLSTTWCVVVILVGLCRSSPARGGGGWRPPWSDLWFIYGRAQGGIFRNWLQVCLHMGFGWNGAEPLYCPFFFFVWMIISKTNTFSHLVLYFNSCMFKMLWTAVKLSKNI